jgi:signal transduction histidine kinase
MMMEKQLRVLIIEDSESDAYLLLRYLKKYGYEPDYELAGTREAVLRALKAKKWDMVVTDYILPQFSGLDTLALLQENHLDTPCIIISGKITEETAVAAMRAGAKDYVMKDNLGRLGPAIERELDEAVIRGERTKAEMLVKEQTTELARVNEQLKLYTKEIIRAQEVERKRVAIELHDDTAQNLALLTLEIDKILESDDLLPEKTRMRMKILRDDVNRTQQDVRRYSHELRPGVLDYLGLEAALEGLAEDINSKENSLEVHLEIKGKERRLPDEIELTLFRIAQESLNNCQKHSHAAQASINLHYYPDRIKLMISDNGDGFDVKKDAQAAIKRRRLGLIGMRERAELVGGKLVIRSILGKGSAISIDVPV